MRSHNIIYIIVCMNYLSKYKFSTSLPSTSSKTNVDMVFDAEEETKERARRAAAAARRWREYSRKGVDKPPAYKLPEAVSNNEK
jgi:hypothetical protein